MIRKEIDKNWTVRNQAPLWEPVPAKVPGDLYSDLLAEGIIDDPYYRDNELAALKLSENDYFYAYAQNGVSKKIKLVVK